MNIVILDGHCANPGDLSWEPLREFGELTVYPRTSAKTWSAALLTQMP